MSMLERRFQADLIQELERRFKGCLVLKNDPNYRQGFPDLLILFCGRWAALEVKRDENAHVQPNQRYYIDKLAKMSFATFIYPENREEVLRELELHFLTACESY